MIYDATGTEASLPAAREGDASERGRARSPKAPRPESLSSARVEPYRGELEGVWSLESCRRGPLSAVRGALAKGLSLSLQLRQNRDASEHERHAVNSLQEEEGGQPQAQL